MPAGLPNNAHLKAVAKVASTTKAMPSAVRGRAACPHPATRHFSRTRSKAWPGARCQVPGPRGQSGDKTAETNGCETSGDAFSFKRKQKKKRRIARKGGKERKKRRKEKERAQGPRPLSHPVAAIVAPAIA